MSERRRNPVQISTAVLDGQIVIYALCDDGSIWWKYDSGTSSEVMSDWLQLIDIPQDAFDG